MEYIISTVLLSFALLSVALTLWQWFAARRFPIRKAAAAQNYPGLTLLKPVKGCDAASRECFESWLQQGYPGAVQILFGVASPDDPVCGLVRDLLKGYPEVDAELILCDPLLGPNAKVSSLCHLAKRAKHEHLVISDADVFVERDFLRKVVEPLQRPSVGLVNCFYILAKPSNFAMRWEAVAVNADFWSQVLQGLMLKPMDFALGAVMATTRGQLERIGGFEALLEYLADDYQLGHTIAKSGAKLEICRDPVECRSDVMRFGDVWNHQLRWSRTIRVCQPAPYFFSILSNATLWPVLYILFAANACPGLAAGALAVRGATAVHNSCSLTGKFDLSVFWMSWVKDLFQVVIWALAFAGNTVVWRGHKFRVTGGGRLEALDH